ncbi:MAG: tRNA pseudouridine(38-40) synthase TruA [Desulfomonilia bacterium]
MPEIRNLKCVLAYDGSSFMGWQIQPGVRTVQETCESALKRILCHEVRVIAAGRTDTGVHALHQVINLRTPNPIPPGGLMRALNSTLPGDVSVLSIHDVSPDFHARTCAQSKTYVYVMDTSVHPNPLLSRYALSVRGNIDITAMQEAAASLTGRRDFSSFQGAGSSVKTSIREVMVSDVFTKGSRIMYRIQGSGFLRHMVRNIVGTLLMVGTGSLIPEDMGRILEMRHRSHAGPTAPPQGLYLVGVEY